MPSQVYWRCSQLHLDPNQISRSNGRTSRNEWARAAGPNQHHDKESFNFGVMAEQSVLPQRTEFQRR